MTGLSIEKRVILITLQHSYDGYKILFNKVLIIMIALAIASLFICVTDFYRYCLPIIDRTRGRIHESHISAYDQSQVL